MRKIAFTLAAVGGLVGAAQADIIVESESNDTMATADLVTGTPGASFVDGHLDSGNVDYFTFFAPAGVLVAAAVYDFTPGSDTDNDSLLRLFRPDGSVVDTDDDDGPGFLSALFAITDVGGMWKVALSGFGDSDFNGSGHTEDFDYKLVIAVNVPTPGSAALLGLGGLVAMRRRR